MSILSEKFQAAMMVSFLPGTFVTNTITASRKCDEIAIKDKIEMLEKWEKQEDNRYIYEFLRRKISELKNQQDASKHGV